MTYTINGINPERITYVKQLMLIIEKIAELKNDVIDVVMKANSITISQKKKKSEIRLQHQAPHHRQMYIH